MKKLDTEVYQAVSAIAPATDSAISARFTPELHAEILGGCLRRLAGAGFLTRSDSGVWRVLTNMKGTVGVTETVAAKILENDVTDKSKTCSACGKEKPAAEFYAKCAQCKRCVIERQRVRKEGAVVPVPRKKAKGVPLALGNGDRMVSTQFRIHITDAAGKAHDLLLAGDTVKRLAVELQEHI